MLKQVGLLQIMAQMGSFVPAERAIFRPADQIFTRMGSDDLLETNSSNFTRECQEIEYILRHATARSLVLVDEFGRSTSPREGLGLAHAVCEQLAAMRAFTLFTTHFAELQSLDMYPNIEKLEKGRGRKGSGFGGLSHRFRLTVCPTCIPISRHQLPHAN